MSTVESTVVNQPRNVLRMIALILVVIGLLISGYLTYTKLTDTATQCVDSGAFNCDAVQSSSYSRLFGIPIQYLGLVSYLVIGALILLEDRVAFLRDYGMMIQFGIILFAFLFSAWLVYVQVFVLESLCVWCLGHEVTMTLLFIVSIPRLMRSLSPSN